MMRGSIYTDLTVFLAIVEHGSLTKAGAMLGISAPAASQRLKRLEKNLGGTLLVRSPQRTSLTPFGHSLVNRVAAPIADLRGAMADVRGLVDRPSGVLRLVAPKPAIDRFLSPLLIDFQRSFPDIELHVTVEWPDSQEDPSAFDVGIRLGHLIAKDMVTLKLGDPNPMVVVAAPSYLARYGTPATPFDLVHHRCVGWRSAGGVILNWPFIVNTRQITINPKGALFCNDNESLLQSIRGGIGIGYLFEDFVKSHIAGGALVEILKGMAITFPPFHIYYPSRKNMPLNLRTFIDFVKTYVDTGARLAAL